jgi:hypothetical protein
VIGNPSRFEDSYISHSIFAYSVYIIYILIKKVLQKIKRTNRYMWKVYIGRVHTYLYYMKTLNIRRCVVGYDGTILLEILKKEERERWREDKRRGVRCGICGVLKPC